MSDRLRWLVPAVAVCAVLCGLAAPSEAQTCAPAWSATQIYTQGNQASRNNVNYQANWWTQGNDPATNNGGAGSGQPWTSIGPCGGSTDTTAPSVPTGLNSPSQTTTSIALGWNASTDNAGGSGLKNYDVLRGGAVVGTVTSTSFTDTGLSANTTFSYSVRARDNSNNVSAASGAISAATKPNTGCSVIPSVPTGLSSPSKTSNSVNLQWNASTSGTGCNVSYRVFQNGSLATTVSGTTASIGGLSANTTYSFSIAATDEAGTSNQGAALSVTTLPTQPNNCTAPLWTPGAIFTGGQRAQHKNYLWEAKWWNQNEPTPGDTPWLVVGYCGTLPGPAAGRQFLPYVDSTQGFNLTNNRALTGGRYTLAFIVDGGGCTPIWGGAPPIPLSTNHYMADIASLRAAGGDVTISFGGAAGTELGASCPSASAIQAAYQTVITKYALKRVDFDVEGGAIGNVSNRNLAIKGLQNANPGLQVSYTLPVLSIGMLPNALAVVQDALAKGVNIASVNVMAMDMGGAYDNGGQMELSAVRAALSTMAQLENLGLSHAQASKMVGVTVMIGQNDTSGEVFKLSDINAMVNDAKSQGIGLLSFWSVTRDKQCADGHMGPPALGDCSGVAQSPLQYSSGMKAFVQ
jgi:chitodextrinase